MFTVKLLEGSEVTAVWEAVVDWGRAHLPTLLQSQWSLFKQQLFRPDATKTIKPDTWLTWHLGHSCCVHGNGRSAAPLWWDPDKHKSFLTARTGWFKLIWCKINAPPAAHRLWRFSSPSQTCSDLQQTWSLLLHTGRPSHPPEAKNNNFKKVKRLKL